MKVVRFGLKHLSDWLSMIVVKFPFFSVRVASCSMYPTLKPNERILIMRIFRFKKIKRREILVFHSRERNKLMVKRVIGLPGDLVEMRAGAIYINGAKLDEPYVSGLDSTYGEFAVPRQRYLFLGDNRAQSSDSRSWREPYIGEQDVLGRALFCFFPLHRFSRLTLKPE